VATVVACGWAAPPTSDSAGGRSRGVIESPMQTAMLTRAELAMFAVLRVTMS
jgi:hypothetical protein